MEHGALPFDPDEHATYLAVDSWARPRLLRYFVAGGAARSEADDLVQETLVRAWRGLAQLREREKLIPWLFAIARRVRSSYRTRRGAERARLVHQPAEEVADRAREADPCEATAPIVHDARNELSRIRRALCALPPQQRQCLLLRVDQELPYGAIAAALRLSKHTVRNHLAQARRALRNALRPVTGRTAPGGPLVARDEAAHLPHEALARRAG
jgi:RNA polymerase sigma-70 factor (ECF subfamily)